MTRHKIKTALVNAGNFRHNKGFKIKGRISRFLFHATFLFYATDLECLRISEIS